MLPPIIQDLIQRFEDNQTQYRTLAYNETETRREFIDPLFRVLEWDVDNTQGFSEKYKEVVHEARVRVGGRAKAPDYAFRIGGRSVFFVEAKKPAVTLKDAAEAAYQVRRYAWSAKLPVSILTNFAEFAVYDCRSKPTHNDAAGLGRIMYFPYTEYPNRWEEIRAHFSPQAIRTGALDRYINAQETKRGTMEVDEAFLAEIEHWRDLLARNFALRNDLGVRSLNFAVQKTIDRIIFLRIAEDRGFEPYRRLGNLAKSQGIYQQLGELFRQADQRYNAGLFYFQVESDREDRVDDFTLNLQLDDKVLKDILSDLYYPESPYAFEALPSDILGQIYEQFLGKVIRLTPSGRAKVEEKPEVKKAGGIVYTPIYIVDHIIEHTLSQLLKGKSYRQIKGSVRYAPLRILDPACGSGTFLLQAYQYLLDWYLEQYLEEGPEQYRGKRIIEGREGWRLTSEERKEILLRHIYGVDIDPQAVEVTKLSLLLKVLENESEETLGTQLTMSIAEQDRVLPDLGNNVQCGNSLISSDFYQGKGQQLTMDFVDEETMYRINAFDWEESFHSVMMAGGFDAIVGNPPYIRIQAMKQWAPQEVEFYKQHYTAASKGNYDIYAVFVEKGLDLLKKDGRLGYILPHKFFNARYGAPLRQLIAQGDYLEEIVHFGDQQVFDNVTTYTCLLFLNKAGCDTFHVTKVDKLDAWRGALGVEPELSADKDDPQASDQEAPGVKASGTLPAEEVDAGKWNFIVGPGAPLYRRLKQMPVTLDDIADKISQGIRTSANSVYVLDLVSTSGETITAHSKELDQDVTLERAAVSLFLRGREIKPYQILPSGKVVIMPYQIEDSQASLLSSTELAKHYPRTLDYLKENRKRLSSREGGKFRGQDWYAYGRKQNIELMLMPKILVPDIADRASFALDERGEYAFTSGYGITLKATTQESIKYVLGLLNSNVLDFYLKKISTPLRGGFFRYFTQYLAPLPIRAVDFSDEADLARHNRMVSLVERILDLYRQLDEAHTPHTKRLLQQQVAITNDAINALVYDLYALTPVEIAIVEDAAV